MSVLAIIPARVGSKGIPHKNWTPLYGLEPVIRAWDIARKVTPHAYISTDRVEVWDEFVEYIIQRPPALAQDDTPMIDVVKHALEQIPGPPDQQIVLLQPTQPLRKPEHITAALELLTPEVDSVVSVVELPRTHHPAFQCEIAHERLDRCSWATDDGMHIYKTWPQMARRRQAWKPTYIRDGTVYAFWRRTVGLRGDLYGLQPVPLIINPNDTCHLDTPLDWIEAERRLKERKP